MAERQEQETVDREPSGFTPQTGGLASEYAREQGWGTNEEERTKQPNEKQDFDGGRDYEYGARDFGDTAVDTSTAQPEGNLKKLTEKEPNKK
jgi:hypothetical protein